MYIKRHEEILNIVSEKREATVAELSEQLDVSEVTIRKDLTTLENMGCLFRIRGGAVIAEDFRLVRTVDVRRQEHIQTKQRIAEYLGTLINPGDRIFLDAGSTALWTARAIRDKDIQITTHSIDILIELTSARAVVFNTPGGFYRKEAGAFVGPDTIRTLQNMQFDLCIVGASGFLDDGVFSSQNTLESEIKRQVLSSSGKRIIAADSSKFGVRSFSIFAHPQDVDLMVTDEGFTGAEAYRTLGIDVRMV